MAEIQNNQQQSPFLGTIIYEPKDEQMQFLLLQDSTTNKQQEFPFNRNLTIEANGQWIPLRAILDDKNLQTLQTAIKTDQPISFILNKNELGKMEQRNLIQNTSKTELSEVDLLKKENKQLKQDNTKLQSKFSTVEKFFSQDKTSLKSFNQFLNNEKQVDKQIDSHSLNDDKQPKISKKASRGMEL